MTRLAAEASELPAVERDRLHTALAIQTGVKMSVVRVAAKEARQRLTDDYLAYALKVVEAERGITCCRRLGLSGGGSRAAQWHLSFLLLRRLECVLGLSKAAVQEQQAKPDECLEFPGRFIAAVTNKIDVRGWLPSAWVSVANDATQTEVV